MRGRSEETRKEDEEGSRGTHTKKTWARPEPHCSRVIYQAEVLRAGSNLGR